MIHRVYEIDKFQHSYRTKYFEMADKRLKNTLKRLNKMLKGIDYCFIGGIAVKEYGYNRTTEDIDILVNKNDETKLYKALKTYNLYELTLDGVGIDVLFSGERINKDGLNYVQPIAITDYHNLLPFIDLNYLIIYKIDSGINNKQRLKDLADVQELIRMNDLPEDYLDGFYGDEYEKIKEKYKELYRSLR